MFSKNDFQNTSICTGCIGEDYLKHLVLQQNKLVQCSYCREEEIGIGIIEMAYYIETAFQRHYEITPDQADEDDYYRIKYAGYQWYQEGEEVDSAIQSAASIPEQAGIDVREILYERNYDHEAAQMGDQLQFANDSYYQAKGVNIFSWQQEWDMFEKSLKNDTRFFNKNGRSHLSEIFRDIEKMKNIKGIPAVVYIGPDSHIPILYRARVFQSNEKLHTALTNTAMHLGPPPNLLANAGRMNAKGISVFYGASNTEVALAEVRPPVGSQVTIAGFKVLRSLKMLDLAAMEDLHVKGSIFDERYAHRLEQAMFLRNLSHRLSKPILPDDQETEYLITQAIADFLSSEPDEPFDGIIFPSSQNSGTGLNVVLFHKAAKVKDVIPPYGTEVDVSLGYGDAEDEWTREYIIEIIKPSSGNDLSKERPERKMMIESYKTVMTYHDQRIPSIEIMPSDIQIRDIKGVSYRNDPYPVIVNISEKQDLID